MQLKICGMKFPENIIEISELHPDYLGFIFYEKSKRNFEGIIPEINKSIKKTGVFVNEYLEIIISLTQEYKLDVIQLHGDESVDYIQELKTHLPKITIIKVFSIKESFDFTLLEPYLKSVDYFLFDTKGKERGGNGVQFNWSVLADYPYSKPFFISGGIGSMDVNKIKDFIKTKAATYCVALDVNSKFEKQPGVKIKNSIEKFKKELGIF